MIGLGSLPLRTQLSVFAIFFVCIAAFFTLRGGFGDTERTYTVTYSEKGFSPAELTISAGDTVVFKNESGQPFWPASDPHPTHTDLGGFDPGEVVQHGQSWSYTFLEPGSWRYHDHIEVTQRGEVFVLGAGKLTGRKDYCDGKCFDELIREAVRTDGVDAAYRLFQETYEKGELPRGCHWTAHQIGEAAFELYRNAESFPISQATSYCGYGFYHGFLESLLREDPDVRAVLKFCDEVARQLGDLGRQNCYHGIGHGYTEDPPDPSFEGNFDAMLKLGTAMCERLFGGTFRDLNVCLTGVFTVPVGFASDGEYGLTMNSDDPFAACRSQPYRYQKACYGEFAAKLDTIINWDLSKLPHYIDSVRDEKLQRLVTWVVPSVMMAKHIQDTDHSMYIEGCRKNFSGRLRHICWGGSILGFFQHGEPDKQYELVARFCRSPQWRTQDEREFCWGEGFRQMKQQYGTERVSGLCEIAPVEYRSLCLADVDSPYDDPTFD